MKLNFIYLFIFTFIITICIIITTFINDEKYNMYYKRVKKWINTNYDIYLVESNNRRFNFKNKNLSQLNSYNNILIIACHTNSQLKVDTLIGNLSYFLKISNNIVIINSLEFKNLNLEKKVKKIYKNINLNFVYIKNNCYLCQGKWF